MLQVVGVIPARIASTRLEEKLLKPLAGRSVIEWTWANARKSKRIDDLIIACDDERVLKTAQGFGAKAVFTSVNHSSGTDRISEAVSQIEAKIVINIQADEPLIHPSTIDSLADQMLGNQDLVMCTAAKEITDQEEIANPNVVKVVMDKDNFALYFSRASIPFPRDKECSPKYYKHIGIYAYTKDFLYIFKNLPAGRLEQIEKLEQLRALEAGFKIKVISTSFDSWGIDTEQDLIKVERILAEKGYA
ncbi:MAG: 3-deoxy-manno-octulosonate cytidylyltransferase [Candidatus Omnitrophica bacterium]|nr:3-deoxy-manno-octulosonate cytidylyltransferase [Candidatus Omnitrophota bacterium]